ncbi:MAG: VOC family protein [Pseudomonadales bacterium]|nr:VOC family protein [Pseudomonadales bacterium]
MARALGVGGVFFKSPNPDKLKQWYVRWLGFASEEGPGVAFTPADLPLTAFCVWSPFNEDTQYFEPSGSSFMVNLVVDDLLAALSQVREGGAEVVGDIERYDYGSFGWFIDPDGNKVELWQPG